MNMSQLGCSITDFFLLLPRADAYSDRWPNTDKMFLFPTAMFAHLMVGGG